jgi:hypothetical protein
MEKKSRKIKYNFFRIFREDENKNKTFHGAHSNPPLVRVKLKLKTKIRKEESADESQC